MNINKTDKNGKALKLGDRVKCTIRDSKDKNQSGTIGKPFEISGVIKLHESGKYYIELDDNDGFWSLDSKTIDWSTMEIESEEQ